MSKRKHTMTARIVSRKPNVWLVECVCRVTFTGATYEATEDQWREHVWDESGRLPDAWGDTKVTRWAPEPVSS